MSAFHPATDDASQGAKRRVWQALADWPGDDPLAAPDWLDRHFSADCAWHVAHPVNEVRGAAIDAALWQPLRRAMPRLERRCDILLAGRFATDGDARAEWVAVTGHYVGGFEQPLFGIPATGRPAWLRFGEFYRVVAGRIVECRVLLDFVDLMRQAGCPVLPPSAGAAGMVPGPRGHDGLLLAAQADSESRASLQLVEAMIFGLHRFDGADLASMGMARFWHPRMLWYGPGGVGSTIGIEGFQGQHQQPFLHAFPDRQGGNHRARIGEGAFVASTGWPSIYATHAGDYLGVPATQRPITMRVMDWWRCRDALLVENWVFIDLPHLMLQMGVDLFARCQHPNEFLTTASTGGPTA